MHYGELVTIHDQGFEISHERLQPLGIQNQSRCWGVTLPDLSDDKKIPHILLSGIPFISWPRSLRLEIRLAHHPGAMATACDVLSDELGLNIISAQCAPSGFHHATWNIISEALNFSDNALTCIANLRQQGKNINDPELREQTSNLSKRAMLCCCDIQNKCVRAHNRLEDSERDSGFLHHRFLQERDDFYTTDAWPLDVQDQERDQRVRPVQSYWNRNLAFAYCYSDGPMDCRNL